MPHALITGASLGLGRALAEELARDGWSLLVDARDATDLAAATERLHGAPEVVARPGDVTDPAHRRELAEVVERWGQLDLLVHNASTLPASPQPPLAQLRTRLHAQAAPGEDLAHLPRPEQVAPGLAAVLTGQSPSGRHRLADLVAAGGGA